MRVYELAKLLDSDSKRIVELLKRLGISVNTHMSSISEYDKNLFLTNLGLVIGKEGKLERINKADNKSKDKINIDLYFENLFKTKLSTSDGTKVEEKIQYVYNTIEDSRKKYGHFKKCELHIHTPESKCYKFLSSWEDNRYSEASLLEIIEEAKSKNLYDLDLLDKIEQNINNSSEDEHNYILKHQQKKPYESFKEYMIYKLIAHNLYIKDIKLAVVCDHHTIEGYFKLKYAINEYFNENRRNFKEDISILMGVEISCSEDVHVIGIFDEKKANDVRNYIKRICGEDLEGSFYPSLQVIKDIIEELDGIAYIAHANSCSFRGNKTYKSMLFNIDGMNAIGLTQIDKKQVVYNNHIKPFINKEKNFCYLYEGDTHTIDNLGEKSTWIKFSNKINFLSFKKAFEDFNVCIRTSKPDNMSKCIKGIIVCPSQFGFLKSKSVLDKETNSKYSNKNDFIIDFSRDLNCIIGGRGTGKSTILNIINTCFNLECDNRTLSFISRNEQIFILFYFNSKDYILRFTPQIIDYYHNGEPKYSYNAFETNYYDEKGNRKLSREWIELYEISGDKENKKIEMIDDIKILNEFYRRGYSINTLVSQIKEGTIGIFIRDVVMNGVDYISTKKFIQETNELLDSKIINYIRRKIPDIKAALESQRITVEGIISDFNTKYKNQLKIIYSPKRSQIDYMSYILDRISEYKNKHVAGTYLTWSEIGEYLVYISEKIGFFEFLYLLFNNKYKDLEKIKSIKHMVDYNKISISKISSGLHNISDNNINSIYSLIYKEISKETSLISECLIRWIKESDDFAIEFNINYKESVQQSPKIFKRLEELSLGQSVAALLTFVFNYGDHAGDSTPLIIDQPEDNLDNQYIYRNLVTSLRDIKTKRQVITVTHNSTIVTTADAEQVIVLDSDNKNGWVQSKGYPSDKTIVNHIINHMEGGPKSLSNKIRKYRYFVKDLDI